MIKQLYKNGEYAKVLDLLSEKIRLDKCSAEEYLLYGSSLYKFKKDAVQALSIFNKIEIAESLFFEINHNIAFLNQEIGNLELSRKYFQKILQRKIIKNNNIYLNIAENFKLFGEYTESINYSLKSTRKNLYTTTVISHEDKVTVLMRMLVMSYILDNLPGAIEIIKELSKDVSRSNAVSTNAAYVALISKMIKDDIRKKNNHLNHTIYYAIGESHAICMHNATFKSNKLDVKIKSKWVEGLKAFHLASSAENKYKSSFEAHMKAMPKNAKVVVVAGEIDCRYDTGIRPAAIKLGMNSLELAALTARNYVDYLSKFKDEGLEIMVWGIPALQSHDDNPAAIEVNSIVEKFSATCRHWCDVKGLKYFDVYEFTIRRACETDYYDRRHLKKETIEMLFLDAC